MTRCVAICSCLMLLFSVTAIAGSKGDKKGVEQAVLDYVEGVYDADPERIKRSVHPELHKFGFARRQVTDDYRVIPMTFEQLVELAREWNADGTEIPQDAPKKVKVLDILDQTASARLTADWGVDYFHLAKYDGQWKIVQVLWQSTPER